MHRKGILYFCSCFLAFVGGHITNYSAIMYAQEIFNSDLLAGIGFGLCFGPPLLLGWFAGAYSDRHSPVKIVVGSQLLFAAAGGLFLLMNMVATGSPLQISLYILTTFLVGAGWSFIAPSRLAGLAQIVSKEALHQATVIFNLLIMIGFGLAPIVIAFVKTSHGWNGVFLGISTLFLTATLMLAGIRTHATTATETPITDQIKEGISGVTSTPLLWQLLVCSMLVYALMGPMQVLLPRFSMAVLGFGEIDRGLFLGVLAASLIMGGILCMALSSRLPLGSAILAGITVGAAAVFSISLAPSGYAAAGALMVAGIAGGFSVSLIVAGLQHQAPTPIRGRVMSIYTITSQVLPALSGLMAGIFSQYFGVINALQISGLAVLLVAITAAIGLKAVRGYKTIGS